jgi:hypothetical protein
MPTFYCKVKDCRYAWSHVTRSHLCGNCHKYGHGEIECGRQSLIDLLRLSETQADCLPDAHHCQMRQCGHRWSHQTVAHHCRSCLKNHSSSDCPLLESQEKVDKGDHGNKVDESYVMKCPLCRSMNKIPVDQKQVYGIDDVCVVCKTDKAQIYFPSCGHVCVCHSCGLELNENKGPDQNRAVPQGQLDSSIVRRALNQMGHSLGKTYVQLPGGMGCFWYLRRTDLGADLEGFFMHSDAWGQYGPETDEKPELERFVGGYTQVQ